jgi:hypothetical protein
MLMRVYWWRQVSTSTGILARQVQLNVVRTEAFIQGNHAGSKNIKRYRRTGNMSSSQNDAGEGV